MASSGPFEVVTDSQYGPLCPVLRPRSLERDPWCNPTLRLERVHRFSGGFSSCVVTTWHHCAAALRNRLCARSLTSTNGGSSKPRSAVEVIVCRTADEVAE